MYADQSMLTLAHSQSGYVNSNPQPIKPRYVYDFVSVSNFRKTIPEKCDHIFPNQERGALAIAYSTGQSPSPPFPLPPHAAAPYHSPPHTLTQSIDNEPFQVLSVYSLRVLSHGFKHWPIIHIPSSVIDELECFLHPCSIYQVLMHMGFCMIRTRNPNHFVNF